MGRTVDAAEQAHRSNPYGATILFAEIFVPVVLAATLSIVRGRLAEHGPVWAGFGAVVVTVSTVMVGAGALFLVGLVPTGPVVVAMTAVCAATAESGVAAAGRGIRWLTWFVACAAGWVVLAMLSVWVTGQG